MQTERLSNPGSTKGQRLALNLFSVIMVMVYFELAHWQSFKDGTLGSDLLYAFSWAAPFILVLPFMTWVIFPLFQMLDKKVNKDAIMLTIEQSLFITKIATRQSR